MLETAEKVPKVLSRVPAVYRAHELSTVAGPLAHLSELVPCGMRTLQGFFTSAKGRHPRVPAFCLARERGLVVKFPHVAAIRQGMHPHISHCRDELLGNGMKQKSVEVFAHLFV